MSKDSSEKQEHEIARVAPTGQKIPWSPILAVVAVVAIYFISQLIGGILISIYPAVRHWSTTQANTWINNSVPAQFVYVVIAEGLTILAVWQFLKHYRVRFSTIGVKRFKAEDVLYAIAGFGVYFIAYAILLQVITRLVPALNVNQQQQIGFQNASGIGQLILTAMSLVILPPIAEEILMRGFLYTSLRKSIPKVAAALVTSVIFASAHLEFGQGAPLLWVAAIDTFVLSLVLVYLREKTGRLWASMGLHALKNAVAFMSIFIFHVR